MANTIQLKLLENKSIVAEINGRNFAYEGGYHIVAGEENATEFEISSTPAQYKDYSFIVLMINSKGRVVETDKPSYSVGDKFPLPIGMAVAGYGSITITAIGDEKSVWLPLKVKVWNNEAGWKDNSALAATVQVGTTETVPAGALASVKNVGSPESAILNFYIPQGETGEQGVGISSVNAGEPVNEGDYTVTPITIEKTDGIPEEIEIKAKNGEGFNSKGNYPDVTVGNVTNAPPPAVGLHHIQFYGEPTPAELWAGTTWEIDTTLQGKTLIGSGGSYSFGATGGSADAVIVEHEGHLFERENDYVATWIGHGDTFGGQGFFLAIQENASTYGNIARGWQYGAGNEMYPKGHSTGESGIGKNMPPYTVVNYWKRTA